MSKHKELHIDIETFSATDISAGVYRYAEDPFFKIQIFAYAFGNDPLTVLDLEQGDKIPRRVIRRILDHKVLKWAHNAQFERVCLSVHILGKFGVFIDPKGWRDTAVYGATLGLPRSLDGMSRALGLSEAKDKEGVRLIRYFAVPCKPTKVNGGRTRNLPEHAPDDWELYLGYCGQDVTVERSIGNRLVELYPEFPEHEWEFYEMDQRINDRGIPVDLDFIQKAIGLKNKLQARSSRKLKRLTGVERHTQLAQLKEWAAKQGYPLGSLNAEAKDDLLKNEELEKDFPKVHRMIKLLNDAGGTAVAKYDKILSSVNRDGRLRGQIIFYGAGATGRFAGKGVQVQNLPRVYMGFEDLDKARERVKNGKSVDIDTLTQLCRTSFLAVEGTELAVSDYSQIEARVLPWYARERWALKAFEENQDIYVAQAVKMYEVAYDVAEAEYRQRGKTGTLALGYGGAKNALIAMGALRDGIPEAELPELVTKWRKANRNIVKFWKHCEQAAKVVIKSNGRKSVDIADGKLKFTYKPDGRLLQIWLPSGRALNYYDTHLGRKSEVKYLLGVKGNGEIFHTDTFGGKIVENIVQATARDLLCEAMLRIQNADQDILFHVHDEAIVEVPTGYDIKDLNKLMAEPLPSWAEGLPLGSEGDTISYYRKV